MNEHDLLRSILRDDSETLMEAFAQHDYENFDFEYELSCMVFVINSLFEYVIFLKAVKCYNAIDPFINQMYSDNNEMLLKLLRAACSGGSLEIVRQIAKYFRNPFSVYDNLKMGAVHYAAMFGNLEIIQYIYSKGNTLFPMDKEVHMPCYFASYGGFVDIVDFFLNVETCTFIKKSAVKDIIYGAIKGHNVNIYYKAKSYLDEKDFLSLLDQCKDLIDNFQIALDIVSNYKVEPKNYKLFIRTMIKNDSIELYQKLWKGTPSLKDINCLIKRIFYAKIPNLIQEIADDLSKIGGGRESFLVEEKFKDILILNNRFDLIEKYNFIISPSTVQNLIGLKYQTSDENAFRVVNYLLKNKEIYPPNYLLLLACSLDSPTAVRSVLKEGEYNLSIDRIVQKLNLPLKVFEDLKKDPDLFRIVFIPRAFYYGDKIEEVLKLVENVDSYSGEFNLSNVENAVKLFKEHKISEKMLIKKIMLFKNWNWKKVREILVDNCGLSDVECYAEFLASTNDPKKIYDMYLKQEISYDTVKNSKILTKMMDFVLLSSETYDNLFDLNFSDMKNLKPVSLRNLQRNRKNIEEEREQKDYEKFLAEFIREPAFIKTYPKIDYLTMFRLAAKFSRENPKIAKDESFWKELSREIYADSVSDVIFFRKMRKFINIPFNPLSETDIKNLLTGNLHIPIFDPNIIVDGDYIIVWAIELRNAEAINCLISLGADIDLISQTKKAPIKELLNVEDIN